MILSYEEIMARCMARIPSSYDSREGSIIYDAIAPAAAELAALYVELEFITQETFADTANGEYLERRAKERGIDRNLATYSVVKGVFTPLTVEIEIGARFSCDKYNYTVIKKITDGEYQLQCETTGTVTNGVKGNLVPVSYIDGLETAEITELLIPAEDDETDDSLRERYFETYDVQAFGGNVKDYEDKTNAIAGVGATKVTPIWNGGGTVKLTILDSQFNKATSTLINNVQQIIDPTQDGQGVGIAPIGHIVTVDTATEVVVNITTTITFEGRYSFDTLKLQIKAAIEDYLLTIRKEWVNNDTSTVRVAQIESRILSVQGVQDVQNTQINGTNANLTLTKYQIPKMGDVTNA